ncbi:MAG: transposase [Anaerolineae bacterium]|nr:transposase [Anaerolineae bacterium]
MSERTARKLPRLAGYDYAQNGAYFVTICTHNREMLFGEIVDGNMQLNNAGEIVLTCWNDLAKHYTQAEYDAFVIMPNHVHAIVVLVEDGRVSDPSLRGAFRPTPTSPQPSPTKPHGLPQIIGSFKSFSARRINEKRDMSGVAVWQGSYYDHIIRDEADLNIRRQYILNNPSRWQEDVEFRA